MYKPGLGDFDGGDAALISSGAMHPLLRVKRVVFAVVFYLCYALHERKVPSMPLPF